MMAKSFLIAFFVLISISPVKSQTKSEKQLSAALEQLRNAMLNADKDVLEKVTSNQLSYGHSSGKIQTKSEFISSLVTKESDFVTLDFSNVTTVVSGKTALVRHQLQAQTADSGKPGTVKLGILLVWQKQGSAWKLLGRQAYKI
ncbi:nuclear transport factor 2 family protein [Hufsiella arboris]|nr:nuclear transport factor 2 family protein [Hufsiella arboris]